MACKVTALVASAVLLALVFLSRDAGVDAWCISFPAPDPNACRGKRGVQTCGDECRDVGHGFAGGVCQKNQPGDDPGDCLCVKCAEQGPPPKAP